ncbi:MAG: hypothetical protein HKN03_18605 [Acidimicrobiales bacterium]|nr:hypothetical protein [Acidimicrobiales bacterium]
METASLWRCLVAYGVDPDTATKISAGEPQTLKNALEKVASRQRASRVSQPLIMIDLASPTENPDFQELVKTLAALPKASRRAVLANIVGGVPIEDLVANADADEHDLTDGLRRLQTADPSRSTEEHLAAAIDLPVPDLDATKARTGQNWLAVGAVGIAAAASILVLTSTIADQADQSLIPGQSSQPLEEPASTTVSTAADYVVEPDREIEISITDENTLIRREPWTRRVIWESRPFVDVEILSIDPNTVTITTRGHRLFVSLTDGTLLPP